MYLDGTSAQLLRRVTELERRMSNLVQIGKITDTDYPGARVQVTIGDLVTGWLPWLTTRASGDISYWAPEKEEQVMVFSPYGELSLGVVLPAIYQNSFPALADHEETHAISYKNHTTLSYNRKDNQLDANLADKGSINITTKDGVLNVLLDKSGQVNITAEGGINLKGNTHITGTLTVTDNIVGLAEVEDSKRKMSGDRAIYNSHTHDVTTTVKDHSEGTGTAAVTGDSQ